MSRPLYYRDPGSARIMRRPVTLGESGGARFTMGCVVCTVSADVDPDDVVALLNRADPPPSLAGRARADRLAGLEHPADRHPPLPPGGLSRLTRGPRP